MKSDHFITDSRNASTFTGFNNQILDNFFLSIDENKQWVVRRCNATRFCSNFWIWKNHLKNKYLKKYTGAVLKIIGIEYLFNILLGKISTLHWGPAYRRKFFYSLIGRLKTNIELRGGQGINFKLFYTFIVICNIIIR
jgi:hypothetical protein